MELFFNKVTINMFGKNQEMTADNDDITLPIRAHRTAIFTAQSKKPMQVRKFIIKAEKSKELWVTDIMMGGVSQLAPNCTAIPIDAFLENSSMTDVRMDSLEAGQIASVHIENRSNETQMCKIMISDESPNLLPMGVPGSEYFEVDDGNEVVLVEKIK